MASEAEILEAQARLVGACLGALLQGVPLPVGMNLDKILQPADVLAKGDQNAV